MLRETKNLICLSCGSEFPYRKSKKFCSVTCRVKVHEIFSEMDRVLDMLTSQGIYEMYAKHIPLPKNFPKEMNAEQARYEDYKFRISIEIKKYYKDRMGKEWYEEKVLPTLNENLANLTAPQIAKVLNGLVSNVAKRSQIKKNAKGNVWERLKMS